MTFSIPWVPPTLNQYSRAHWTRQREWVRIAAVYIHVGLVQSGHRFPCCERRENKVRVTIQQHRRRPVDRDNLTPKVLNDALVKLGIVVDDNEDHIEQVVLPVIVDRRAEPRTEITLEDIEED